MTATKKQRGLGRGLGALMAELPGSEDVQNSGNIAEVDILLVDNDKSQPRKHFDQEKLEELAQSIRLHGVMQPVLVYETGGRYTIVAGERRFRAAKLAGLKKLPVIIRKFTQREILEHSLIENIQREDLNPMEQAGALMRLTEEYGLKQEEVAARVGKSRSAIANLMRLLSLPGEIKTMVEDGRLSAGHARALLPLADEKRIVQAANTVIDKEFSVRHTETFVREALEEKPKNPPRRAKMPVEMLEAEEVMSAALSTKVRLNGNLKKGKITIDYYTEQQLESLFEFLKSAE